MNKQTKRKETKPFVPRVCNGRAQQNSVLEAGAESNTRLDMLKGSKEDHHPSVSQGRYNRPDADSRRALTVLAGDKSLTVINFTQAIHHRPLRTAIQAAVGQHLHAV